MSARPVYRPRNRKLVRIHLKRKHLAALLMFAAFVLLRVWQNANVDHLHRSNGILKEELKLVRDENLALEAQIEKLRSMERLSQVVRDELQMEEVPIITLREKNAFERLTDTITRKRK